MQRLGKRKCFALLVVGYLLPMACIFYLLQPRSAHAPSDHNFFGRAYLYSFFVPDQTPKFNAVLANQKLEERENYLREVFLSKEPNIELSPDLRDFDTFLLSKHQKKLPVGAPKKYFKEYRDPHNRTFFHCDARFYKPLPHQEMLSNVHVLFGAFVKMASEKDILFWISHGALIGWYWNNLILPWDDDIDVQTSVAGFLKLIELNQTVFEKRYLLDVNPYALGPRHMNWRTKNLELNRIDARFIDIENGMFLDITMLSIMETHADPNSCTTDKIGSDQQHLSCEWKIGCQAHAYHYNELFPIQRTLFDDFVVWRPNQVTSILKGEYGTKAMMLERYNGYTWAKSLNRWTRNGSTKKP